MQAFEECLGIKKQIDVANQIGVKKQVLNGWKAGKSSPINHLAKVSELTGRSIDWLLGATTTDEPPKEVKKRPDPVSLKFEKLASRYKELPKKQQTQVDPVIEALDAYIDALEKSE